MNKILDNDSGIEETILETYQNSILVTQTKRTEKGINCTQWFDTTSKEFKKRFQ